MKIICTEDEREDLLDMVLASGDVCPFETHRPKHCKRCDICFLENVEWEIKYEITKPQPWWENEGIFKEG